MADRSEYEKPATYKTSKHYFTGMIDDSCILCGIPHVSSGRILHGHCVCEDCVDYIIKNEDREKD